MTKLKRALTQPELDQFDAVAERIEAQTHIRIDAMLGPSKVGPVSAARQHLWCALRELHWSYPAIATLFRRDHTTVMYGVRMARKREEARAGGSPRLPFRSVSSVSSSQAQAI